MKLTISLECELVFDFVLDAFPDYTRWDQITKVLCAIQTFETSATAGISRWKTVHDHYEADDAHNEPYKG